MRSLPAQPLMLTTRKQADLPSRLATRPPAEAPTAPVMDQAQESTVAARCSWLEGTSTGTSALRAAVRGGRAGGQTAEQERC